MRLLHLGFDIVVCLICSRGDGRGEHQSQREKGRTFGVHTLASSLYVRRCNLLRVDPSTCLPNPENAIAASSVNSILRKALSDIRQVYGAAGKGYDCSGD